MFYFYWSYNENDPFIEILLNSHQISKTRYFITIGKLLVFTVATISLHYINLQYS